MMNEKYIFECDGNIREFDKIPEDKDKYVICTCAKNENDYILDFIEHYLSIGFDKILIADNNDDTSLEDVVKDYINKGRVQIFDCRGMGSFQIPFYTLILREGNYKWCGYYDVDEFLEIPNYNNVKDYLYTIKEDVLCFHWIIYGSNNQYFKKEGNLGERFVIPYIPISGCKENTYVKSLVRGGKGKFEGCRFFGSHIPINPNDLNGITYNIGGDFITNIGTQTHYPMRYKNGYIKHFYTKSLEEWDLKQNRGWPDGTPSLNLISFFQFDKNGEPSMNKYNYDIFSQVPCYVNNDSLKNFDVFKIKYRGYFVYGLIINILNMMHATTDSSFIICTEAFLDDNLYTIFLEHAFITGNRMFFINNNNNDIVWNIHNNYSKKKNGFFIIPL